MARALPLAVLLAAATQLGACGNGAAAPANPSATTRAGSATAATGASTTPTSATPTSSTTATAPSAPPGCVAAAKTVCVTAASTGKRVTVGVGWNVAVYLKEGSLEYGLPSASNARVLMALGAAHRRAGAIVAAYRAIGPGSAVLRTTARPRCAPGSACPAFIVLWQVYVRVR